MFLPTRPTPAEIDRFLANSAGLSLSYELVHILDAPHARAPVDEALAAIGRGRDDFIRACEALRAWKQFDIGWVETFPKNAPIKAGTVVAVLIRHFGFWSLNGCRVVYPAASSESGRHFGFAYGTLSNHAESGEELFEVFMDPQRGDVMYRIRATSRPQATIARICQPIVRALQARFRRDSVAAMKRVTSLDEARS